MKTQHSVVLMLILGIMLIAVTACSGGGRDVSPGQNMASGTGTPMPIVDASPTTVAQPRVSVTLTADKTPAPTTPYISPTPAKVVSSTPSTLPSTRVLTSATSITSTNVIQYVPQMPLGEASEKGNCWTGSLAAPWRADAWRCNVDGKPPKIGIHDPCFSLKGETDVVVCGMEPQANNPGFKVKVTGLPSNTPSELPNAGWRLELEDGSICQVYTGTSAVVDGKRVNYTCNILGQPQVGPVWMAEVVRLDRVGPGQWIIIESKTVAIRTVWR